MKNSTRIYIYALLLSALYPMVSCTADYGADIPAPGPGPTAELSILADMPAETELTTRGETGSVSENTIDDIHILVFAPNGDLVSKSRGKNLSIAAGADNNNKVTFKATLPVGSQYTFMVLANAAEWLSGIDVGTSPAKKKSDVEALAVERSGKWDSGSPSIPMWGEKDMTLTASSTPSFELTRMLARINVDINLADASPGVPADNFRLTSVRYYNYNTSGALVPGAGNYDQSGKCAVNPTIPSTAQNRKGESLVYNGTDITDNRSCSGKIYVFEAAHNGSVYNDPDGNADWIDNPCLVVGGRYRTDEGVWLGETFYRVDFIRKSTDPSGNVTDVWLSVLRNFSYNVTITRVEGSGFPDPDTALNSAPINMEANILDWNERDMGEIVFDGVFYLSVSRDEFTFQRTAVTDEREENTVYIKTDYVYANDPDHTDSGWRVEKYVDGADGTTPVSWLKLNPEKGAPNDRVKAFFTFEENTLPTNRTAVVWIAAGRLRYPIYVTQRIISLDILDPDNGMEPVERMDFVVPRTGDTSHQPRHFTVEWTPIDKDVSITAESPQVWNPFEPGWLTPDPDAIAWNIDGGPGTQTFEVRAPTVDQSAVDLDPFYERESTYYFTIANGDDSETKGITLHQIYYNIVVDTYSYLLDGRTYTLSVRSNTEWVITNNEQWLYNSDPNVSTYPNPDMLALNQYDNLRVGTTGGPNTSGESIAFTVVDNETEVHKNKWGTVYVTFESPEGKFPPVRAALTFPPKRLSILGLGYSKDDRSYCAGAASSIHDNGVYNMLQAAINFGNIRESAVRINRLDVYGYNCPGSSVTNSTYGNTWDKNDLKSYINSNPDVLIISYSMRLDQKEAQLVLDYINNGGAAIMLLGGQNDASGSYAENFLKLLLEDPDLSCRRMNYNISDVYRFPDGEQWKDHPVLDGPFGDIRGKHWGGHTYTIGFIPSDPSVYDQIEIINTGEETMYRIFGATTQHPYTDHILAFRHKTKNVIWLGCDSFISGYPRGQFASRYYDPFLTDEYFRPAVRPGFGHYYSTADELYDVYNSYAIANMIAWAISVTNHRPPAEGYDYR